MERTILNNLFGSVFCKATSRLWRCALKSFFADCLRVNLRGCLHRRVSVASRAKILFFNFVFVFGPIQVGLSTGCLPLLCNSRFLLVVLFPLSCSTRRGVHLRSAMFVVWTGRDKFSAMFRMIHNGTSSKNVFHSRAIATSNAIPGAQYC